MVLGALLDSRENQIAKNTAQRLIEALLAGGLLRGTLDTNFPLAEPQWDPNNQNEREALSRHQN